MASAVTTSSSTRTPAPLPVPRATSSLSPPRAKAVFWRALRELPTAFAMHELAAAASSSVLTVHDAELVESRRAWRDGDFISDYRKYRPMVERSIAWLVKRPLRRVRFRGVEKNQMGLTTRVAAINLRRLINLGLVHDGAWRLVTT